MGLLIWLLELRENSIWVCLLEPYFGLRYCESDTYRYQFNSESQMKQNDGLLR